MEQGDVDRERDLSDLSKLMKAAYAAGKAAERPFDRCRPEQPRLPAERDEWHH